MNDIKIPDAGSSPPGKKPEFEVTHLGGASEASPHSHAGEHVKVKFEKFVQLVATHDFEGVMKRHATEDIVMSTNLLTDLANAHQEEPPESGKKLPIIFIVGIIIGVALTYLVVRF